MGKKSSSQTKTNHDRTISIPQISCNTRQTVEVRTEPLSTSLSAHSGSTRITCLFRWKWETSIGGLDTPYKAFHRILKHYNATRQQDEPALPLIPFHGLRHTAATLLIANGVNIRTVSGRLGHTNTSTTLNIYSHALEEFDRKASDVLADTLMKKA